MVKVIAVFLDTLASLLGSGSHVPRRNPVFPTLCVESGNAERCRLCVHAQSVGTRARAGAFALWYPITTLKFLFLLVICAAVAHDVSAASIGNAKVTLLATLENQTVCLELSGPQMKAFASGPYVWHAVVDGTEFDDLTDVHLSVDSNQLVITGRLGPLDVEQRFVLLENGNGFREVMRLGNGEGEEIRINDLRTGFGRAVDPVTDATRMVAVPYRRQADGGLHDYSMADIAALTKDSSRLLNMTEKRFYYHEAPLACEMHRRFRSEGWVFTDGSHSLLVFKYNNKAIEYSAVNWNNGRLVFGGCAFVLFDEPVQATYLDPGEEFVFGETHYEFFEGDWPGGYERVKAFMNARGHGLIDDYVPEVHWNALYDLGWYLEPKWAGYSREEVLQQAAYAKELGCTRLYLDPGWQKDTVEASTLWDETRFGPLDEMVRELRDKYGLELGLWTAMRIDEYTKDQWPKEFLQKGKPELGDKTPDQLCMSHAGWRKQKLQRLLEMSQAGVQFWMFDFLAWNGPCYATDHGHPSPSTQAEHLDSIYGIAREVRRRFPNVRIEMHDAIWPWGRRYLPNYFRQGLKDGDYDENWAYEFMWNTIDDLRSGKALCLYYYNLAYDIPMYNHFNMKADNDQCLSFWWMASTVRHIGIGGRTGKPVAEYTGKLPDTDMEKRFAAYKNAMVTYNRLKRYFTQGRFTGIDEMAHLHTLDGETGGVLVLFNIEEHPVVRRIRVPVEPLGLEQGRTPEVKGAEGCDLKGQELTIEAHIDAESPAVIEIGI